MCQKMIECMRSGPFELEVESIAHDRAVFLDVEIWRPRRAIGDSAFEFGLCVRPTVLHNGLPSTRQACTIPACIERGRSPNELGFEDCRNTVTKRTLGSISLSLSSKQLGIPWTFPPLLGLLASAPGFRTDARRSQYIWYSLTSHSGPDLT